MPDREALFRNIQELSFACIDLNLFLDTHPDNEDALNDFNEISIELNKLKRLYEMNFSPLTNYGTSPSKYPWGWLDSPWPWEKRYGG